MRFHEHLPNSKGMRMGISAKEGACPIQIGTPARPFRSGTLTIIHLERPLRGRDGVRLQLTHAVPRVPASSRCRIH